MKIKNKLENKILGVIFLIFFMNVNILFAEIRDNYSDTWVGTDGLGRVLPTNAEVGNPKTDKTVGLFYYIWMQGGGGVYDNTKIIAANPNNPEWGPLYWWHWWGEPWLGYYNSNDDFVIKKHAQMLADAGVDVIIFDNTNAITYQDTVLKLCNLYSELKANGCRVPKITFILWSSPAETLQAIYNYLYSKNLYQDLWFYWKGKPLILCDKSKISNQTLLNFFTFRTSWAWSNPNGWFGDGYHRWPWLDNYPQNYGWDIPGVPEEMPIEMAQHPTGNIGRSYDNFNGGQPPVDNKWMTTTSSQGIYFEQLAQRALQVSPEFLFITQWNEWIAQRFLNGQNGFPLLNTFAGRPAVYGQTVFVDEYNEEFSRDAEPNNGKNKDNYYYQMVSIIRKYKGVRPIPQSSDPKTIQINNNFSQWDNVGPDYIDDIGDTYHRDFQPFGSSTAHTTVPLRYTNNTGRNDIALAKVARNAQYFYFYVRTTAPLTSPTDSMWMLLFIDSDHNWGTGWNGYDYLINRTRTGNTCSIEKNMGGWNWQKIADATIYFENNNLHIAIPRSILGLDISKGKATFDFKWADNMPVNPNIMDFIDKGDIAPDLRFNYRFIEAQIPSNIQTEWYYISDSEGWMLSHNITGSVANSIYTLNITGSDPFMHSPDNLGIDASKYKYIRVRMKNGTSGSGAQFYWITGSDNVWNEAKHIDFGVMANDRGQREYVVDLSGVGTWSGTIRQIRFDPPGSSGVVELDYIKVEKGQGIEPGNIYRIEAKHSGKSLTVEGDSMTDGGNIEQRSYVGKESQKWEIVDVGDNYYRIKAQNSGKVLDVAGAGLENGANVHQWGWLGGENQKWKIDCVEGEYYRLTAKHSGKVLDVEGVSTQEGANVYQWEWLGGENQKWRFTKIAPTPTNTATLTNTRTNTATATRTNTATNTATATRTMTVTNTKTNTATNTPTVKKTMTATNTKTNTATSTMTQTFANTVTNTNTNTRTNTATNTATNTVTDTRTNTVTNTNTPTSTNTVTNTMTATNTMTNTYTQTKTITNTNTATNTATATRTNTQTNTVTNTNTQLPTNTNTPILTNTATNTKTSTLTHTFTNTATSTATETNTEMPTNTLTNTGTNKATDTFTNTPTNTSTNTTIPTNTKTNTATSTVSKTATLQPSLTFTSTATFIPSATLTPNATQTNTKEIIENIIIYPNPYTGNSNLKIKFETKVKIKEVKIEIYTSGFRKICQIKKELDVVNEVKIKKNEINFGCGTYYLIAEVEIGENKIKSKPKIMIITK